MAEPRPSRPPMLGPYELLERIGHGGMAEVYVARRGGPHGFSKKFAVKRILPQLASDSRFVAMFCDEARICAALSHPNIVQVVDFGEHDGQLFMAMEHVDGLSVARLLRAVAARQQKVPLSVAAFITLEVLKALDFAHHARDEEGRPLDIVHRDVSPGNVLVGRAGEVKLGDFGIVLSSFVDRRTYPGELKGKIGYMSPEQVVGADLDARSDLFTLGIILSELLVARPLFPGRDELEVLTAIHQADLRVLEAYGTDVPPRVLEVLRTALRRERESRYQSARDFALSLERAVDDCGVSHDVDALVSWLHGLGVLPTRSGTRPITNVPTRPVREEDGRGQLRQRIEVKRSSVLPPPPSSAPETQRPRLALAPDVPQLWLRLQRGAALGPMGLPKALELVATGRVGLSTEASFDGVAFRPLAQVKSLASLALRAPYRLRGSLLAVAERRGLVSPLSVAQELFDISYGARTGALILHSGTRWKHIYFELGRPRYVVSGERQELLGHRLFDAGIVGREDVERALIAGERSGQRLGEALVAQGALRAGELLRLLGEQLDARVSEALAWRHGELAFVPDLSVGEQAMHGASALQPLLVHAIAEHVGEAELTQAVALSGPRPIHPAPRFSRMAELEHPVLTGLITRLAAQQTPALVSVARLVSEGIDPALAMRTAFLALSAGLLTTDDAAPRA